MSYSIGDTVVLDGIESVIIYDAGSDRGWGRYLCVDKNHDLCYYFTGSDYVNDNDSSNAINSINKYGYEWGGYGISSNVKGYFYEDIGKGLSNTNTLIEMNLQPDTPEWNVVWDKVKEFRALVNSNGWFVPSSSELHEVFSKKEYLNNISTSDSSNPYYWESEETSEDTGMVVYFHKEGGSAMSKNSHRARTRLCRYIYDKKSIQISTSTSGANIYFTLDKTSPTENSNLYRNTFSVQSGTTVKAVAKKEGYIDSDEVHANIIYPPLTLPDGSVLFYDRGEQYGSYHLNEQGYPERDDGLIDDETIDSQNWRYFIIWDTATRSILAPTSNSPDWGPMNVLEGFTSDKFGSGLSNTLQMINKYSEDPDYWWYSINIKNATEGFHWFVPSKEEFDLIPSNRDVINFYFRNSYYDLSSTEDGDSYVYAQNAWTGNRGGIIKDDGGTPCLIRRI